MEDFSSVDLSENLLYEIAGGNINLEMFLRLKSGNDERALILKIPILNKLVISFLLVYLERYGYEVALDIKDKLLKPSLEKYDYIFFATRDSYLNPLLEVIKNKKRNILIIPKESRGWINYKKIIEENISFVFLEDIIQFDENRVEEIRKEIKKRYLEKRRAILFYKYNVDFIESQLKKLLFNFVPTHIVVVEGIRKYLFNVSHSQTQFYVAKDRKALENSFIQIANQINGNTNMVIHGLLSSNYKERFWGIGRFDGLKNVYIWSKHDKEVIEKISKLLNKKAPNILVSGNIFFKKVPKNNASNTILFICEPSTKKYIPFFRKNLPENYRFIVRFHPASQKDEIIKCKKYEKNNFLIDDLKKGLSELLEEANLVLGYSSTGTLEAMYNEIPVLILGFKDFKKTRTILKESPISENEFDIITINKDNYRQKIDKIFTDESYREQIIKINKKIYEYFVQ